MTGAHRLVAATLLGLLLLAAPAQAQGDRRAKRLLQKAHELHGAGEFKEAIGVLKQAADKTSTPRLLARIHGAMGVNLHVVNRKQMAREAFVKALTADPVFTLDASKVGKATVALLEQTRRGLHGTLLVEAVGRPARVTLDGKPAGRPPLQVRLPVGGHALTVETDDGRWACAASVVVRHGATVKGGCALNRLRGKLSVVSVPSGARVTLGGEVLGVTPLRGVAVPVGQHELRLRLAGYAERVLKVSVNRAGAEAVAVQLQKEPALTPATKKTTPMEKYQSSDTPKRKRLWTWVAAGSAVATAVAGAVLIGVVEGHVDEWDSITDPGDPRLDELEVTIPREAWARNVLLGAAGALAATAVLLYLLEGRPTAGEKRAAPMVAPTVGQGAGLMVSVPF